ncbi:MAG: hypothetical protein U1B80_03005 [Anaerolineaceae bacterium]|nr:hypothetical protein [Anaerolineaceae bacterium]
MERTVPTTASEEIELYLRTIYSLLRSTTEVYIRTLEEVHAGTSSLLHPDARQQSPILPLSFTVCCDCRNACPLSKQSSSGRAPPYLNAGESGI